MPSAHATSRKRSARFDSGEKKLLKLDSKYQTLLKMGVRRKSAGWQHRRYLKLLEKLSSHRFEVGRCESID